MSNDDAAQRLIDALLPKITEALLPQLSAAVEEQIKGISKKNDELLEKLTTVKDQKDTFADLLAAHDKQMKDTRALLDGGKTPPAPDKSPVLISRADALNVAKYQEAKKLAAERGTTVQIEGRAVPEPKADPRTHVQTDTHLYVAASAARDTPTYKRLRAQAADARLEFAVVKELPDADA